MVESAAVFLSAFVLLLVSNRSRTAYVIRLNIYNFTQFQSNSPNAVNGNLNPSKI